MEKKKKLDLNSLGLVTHKLTSQTYQLKSLGIYRSSTDPKKK